MNGVMAGIALASIGLMVSMYGAFDMHDSYRRGFKIFIVGNGLMMAAMLLKEAF